MRDGHSTKLQRSTFGEDTSCTSLGSVAAESDASSARLSDGEMRSVCRSDELFDLPFPHWEFSLPHFGELRFRQVRLLDTKRKCNTKAFDVSPLG